MFTGLGFLHKEHKSGGHTGKQNSFRTNIAEFHYTSLCCILANIPFLSPSAFPSFLSFRVVFSPLKDGIGIL